MSTHASGESKNRVVSTFGRVASVVAALAWVALFGVGMLVNLNAGRTFLLVVDFLLLVLPFTLAAWYYGYR